MLQIFVFDHNIRRYAQKSCKENRLLPSFLKKRREKPGFLIPDEREARPGKRKLAFPKLAKQAPGKA
jgi:hypothetical protein